MPQVNLIKNPFDRKNDILKIDYGTNLQEIADNINLPDSIRKTLVVYKLDENLDNPVLIDKKDWATTFPKDGEHYQLFSSFAGGGGQGGGKGTMRMVAMVAVMAAAMYFAPMLAGAVANSMVGAGMGASMTSLATGATTFFGAAALGYGLTYGATYLAIMGVGMALTNALIPLPKQKVGASESNRTLTNSSNAANPYYPIPRIYGKTRFSPYKVAPDYTEQVGDDTYLRCLFCFGYGPLKISDIKIGDNPIDNYSEVEYEIREGWPEDEPITLYSNQVITQSYSIELGAPKSQDFVTRSAVDEAVIQLTFAEGLYHIRSHSKENDDDTASFIISYRAEGDEDWIVHSRPTWNALETSPFIKSVRIKFPQAGTYQIRVQQTRGVRNELGHSAATVTAIQNIRYQDPVRKKGFCLMAVRIKATDQLSGSLDAVSALCESYEKVFSNREIKQEVKASVGSKSMGQFNTVNEPVRWSLGAPLKKAVINIAFPNGIGPVDGETGTVHVAMKYSWSGKTRSGVEVKGEKTYDSGFVDTDTVEPIVEEVWNNNDDPLVTLAVIAQKTAQERRYNKEVWRSRKLFGSRYHWYKEIVSTTDGSACNAPITVNVDYEYENSVVAGETTQSAWVLNRHPAWHVYDMLTGTACVTKIKDENIDIQSFIHWAETYPNWLVDKAIDGEYTRLECIKNMCSAAKATITLINGKYTIVLDEPGKVPVAAISPRNSFNFSFNKSFSKDLHGFKVNYIEPERDWSEQQVIVYAKGYDETNATEFESIDTYGCTDRTQAWRFGKYMMAQYFLRPETYVLSQDIENLAVNVGDVVRLSHDILKVGYGSARVKEVYLNEDGRATGLWVDDKFYLPDGNTYAITVRSPYGEFRTYAVAPNESEEDILTFPTPLPKDVMPESGSMLWIGETNRVFTNVIIKQIEPSDDLCATLTCVPQADEVHDETATDIPDWDPIISENPVQQKVMPLAPQIVSVLADESVLVQDITGGWKSAIQVTVAPQPEDSADIESVQIFYKPLNGIIEYKQSFPFTGYDACILNHVSDGRTYDIKVRYVSKEGYVSPVSTTQVTVEGQLNPPPDILNLDRQGYNITWNYDNKPKDFSGFRIYYNHGYDTTFGYAVKAHTESVWDSPPFTTATLPKGPLTLFVVAVDMAGNESEVPATISFYNGDTEFDNVLQTYDHIANQGEITEGYVFDNAIYANESGVFYPADGVRFYDEDDKPFYGNNLYKPMVYEFDIEYTGDVEDAYAKLDYDMEGVYKVWYKRESKIKFYKDSFTRFYDRYNYESTADKTQVVDDNGSVIGYVVVSPTLAYNDNRYIGEIVDDEIISSTGAVVGYVTDYPNLLVINPEEVIYDASGDLLGYQKNMICYDLNNVEFGKVETNGLIKNSLGETTGFWGYPVFELSEGLGSIQGFCYVGTTDCYDLNGNRIGFWNKDVEGVTYNFFYPQGEHWYLFPDKLLINNERIHVKIIFEAGTSQGIIRKLISVIDAPDTTEYLSQVRVSKDGTRLPIEKRYKVINKVFLTLQGQGDVGSCRVLDYNINGPLVKVYDTAGNAMDAIVDADVRGYR